MPKYELMYIIGNNTSDDEIPKVIEEVKTAIEKNKGSVDHFQDLEKKRLTYPIKKSNIGHYIVTGYTVASEKANAIEHAIKTNQAIIRHLIINMDESLVKMEKDKAAQAKLQTSQLREETEEKPVTKPAAKEKKISIDLDAEIEKAIDIEDLK